MRIDGFFIAAQVSRRQTATLIIAESGQKDVRLQLVLGDNAPPITVQISAVSPPLAGADMRITLGGQGVFILRDDHLPRALTPFLPQSRWYSAGLWLAVAERLNWRYMIIMLAVIVAMAAGIRVALPMLATQIAAALPDRWLAAVGDTSLAQLDNLLLEPSQLPVAKRREITGQFNAILAQLPPDQRDIRLHFRQSADIGPNAFALPGRHIIVLDALVEFVGADSDALTAVLAHEAGHVIERHSARMIAEATLVAVAAALIFGADESLIEEMGSIGASLMLAEQSRGFELEADRVSTTVLTKMGKDPRHLVTFFDRIEQACGAACDGSGFFASHPSFATRRQQIRDHNQR
jgi:predicted Zn-dependent protease